jgi:hypothetical protein
MPPLIRDVRRSGDAGWGWWVAALAVGVVLVGTSVHAQNRPPRPNEPIAMEAAMAKLYRGLNVVVVKTMDGVEHVYNFTKDLIVHGGKKPGVDALAGLREGTTVVVHYSTTGAKALAEEIDVTEGMVTDIDRGKREITIRFAGGQTETLQMTTRAAAESQRILDDSDRSPAGIIVYYADEAGRKVAHYFKRAS